MKKANLGFWVSCGFLAVMATSVSANATEFLPVVQECRFGNPDAAVVVKILDAGSHSAATHESSLLIAVLLSYGNMVPHVIGTFPVKLAPVNGAGITGYLGDGFSLTFASQTKVATLRTAGPQPIEISESVGPLFSCN